MSLAEVSRHLQTLQLRLQSGGPLPLVYSGSLVRVRGLILEAQGLQASLGERCRISTEQNRVIDAEVVGFNGDHVQLMALGEVQGLTPGARVYPVPGDIRIPVGPELLGRVLDGNGRPLDGDGPLLASNYTTLSTQPINPLSRALVRQPLDVGVRAINALFTVGRGARMGLFAGSGVGKSVLLGMMARNTDADIIIVGLIGERGREVKEFIEDILGGQGRSRAVVIAAPADAPALTRIRGARLATAMAEYYRDQGLNVLLLMDSITRYALALREVALAAGEPPAARGFPPSVFAKLPALVERAGNGPEGGGSITAFYTVLMEGDDQQDPVADNVRAILDGHIVLSRRLAEQGHFPAIDLQASISRVMPAIASAPELRRMQRLKELQSRYASQQDLIAVGAYTPGADPQLDQAVQAHAGIRQFLIQDLHQAVSLVQSRQQLADLMTPYLPAPSDS
ncbi:MAG: FliI/YscN family ATPase [Thiomonas sp.]|uniref:FliI/YscN family ATPase n=1 Tax=Thiomonas sp. TaxID=2047785 RepID=UPI002A371DC3|nr:FliI/YscN family ATPase [Thiomonas sp.]MDY0331359.1 FliI/YscN family ATPase [Thiomonas sp.]